MNRGRGIIGSVTSLRQTLACRVFALLFVVLIVSPFTAPFATFELIAIADVAEGGDDPVKTAIDVAVHDSAPAALLMTPMLVRERASQCDETQAPPSFQAVLRI